MHRSRTRPGLVLALFTVTLLAGAAAALAVPARHRAPCSPSAGPGTPQLLSPCNHAVLRAGKAFTFRVKDFNSEARTYPPYLNLTAKGPKHGVLKDATGARGIFDETRAVRGHSGLYTLKTPLFTYSGYWLVTPGKYYLQLQQIGVTGRLIYSPVETVTVR